MNTSDPEIVATELWTAPSPTRDPNDVIRRSVDDILEDKKSLEQQLRQLSLEFGQDEESTRHVTRLVVGVSIDRLTGDDQQDPTQWLRICLMARYGFWLIQSVDVNGPFGKTRLRAGQCMIGINGSRTQQGALEHTLETLLHRGILEIGCCTLEAIDAWGDGSVIPIEHTLIQLEKPQYQNLEERVPLGLSIQKDISGDKVHETRRRVDGID